MPKFKNLTDIETIYRKSVKTIVLKVKRPYVRSPYLELETVSNPVDVYQVLQAIFAGLDEDQEHLILLVLNFMGEITGYKLVSSGGQDRAIIDTKVLFRNALLLGASKIILAHNHPSGRIDPSKEDLSVTAKVVEAGSTLDIEVLDHIIYASQGFTSIRQLVPEIFTLEEASGS
ncbi:MAG: JAB domain-containing protein [Caldilineaceae bacterium]